METNDILIALAIVLLITVAVGGSAIFGILVERHSAYNHICTESGYDGYQRIEGKYYCYKSEGSTMVLVPVLVAPLSE